MLSFPLQKTYLQKLSCSLFGVHESNNYLLITLSPFPPSPSPISARIVRVYRAYRRSNGFLRDSYNLPCGHTFCLECINDALADKNSCPTCMNPAWQKDILKTALAVRDEG